MLRVRSSRLLVCLLATLAGFGVSVAAKVRPVPALSPDGRNEIRLEQNGGTLAYSVLRDGVVVAAAAPIGLRVDGRDLFARVDLARATVTTTQGKGTLATPIYKKSSIDLAENRVHVAFPSGGAISLVARNDGVAYRLETTQASANRIENETASLAIPMREARCWFNTTGDFGMEESLVETARAADVFTGTRQKRGWGGDKLIYLPFVYSVAGKTVAVTESDVRNYPIWNLTRTEAESTGGAVLFKSCFAGFPQATKRGGRRITVDAHEPWLVESVGARTLPWRVFILADEPSKLCEADIVFALAAPAEKGSDFSWVKPGKAAWDWWNDWNLGNGLSFQTGCNTKTYERYIDFAGRNGIEYFVMDEGWCARLDIRKPNADVDLSHLINYAAERNVGIILWMAWAQVFGDEERVAAHFGAMGVKGFKVDFIDRGDAQSEAFMERFAAACAKYRLVVDFHGVHHPTGLQRRFPNILNYEGVHGLENLRNHARDGAVPNDVRTFFCRMTAGPMDFTPGAMRNFARGDYKPNRHEPGALGTRCRQLAMAILYEAPLQMLCDSPAQYEANRECLDFLSSIPTVWDDVKGLAGDPDSYVVAARRRGRDWFVAGMTDWTARDFVLETQFLGSEPWRMELFSDALESDAAATDYRRQVRHLSAGERIPLHLASGGGFAIRFTPAD